MYVTVGPMKVFVVAASLPGDVEFSPDKLAFVSTEDGSISLGIDSHVRLKLISDLVIDANEIVSLFELHS